MRKKKVDKKTEPKEKKSRAKYQCPPELEDLIYQVNLLPPDFDFKSFNKAIKRQLESLSKKDCLDEMDMKDCLRGTPESFQLHIRKLIVFHPNFFQPFITLKDSDKPARFADHYDLEGALSSYERMYRSIWGFFSQLEMERQYKDTLYRDHSHWDISSYTVIIIRGDDGLLHHTGLSALIGKFDDSRLRRCEICNRIFWANYKNSFTCSKPCLNALRQRRHRKTNADAINEKRRDNYRHNKKQRLIKEK
ncbi:MAG: hypothetical protein WKF90_03720 [Pyrinomonadaceae bacterium]